MSSIECDEFVAHPPEAVWRALTDPDLLARWWAPGDVRAEVGHRFSLDMGPWGQQSCTVTTVEEPRLLRYTFADGVLDSTLTWRLVPEGTGTRVFLVHEGFDLDTPLGRQAHHGMGQGWPAVLTHLGQVLSTLSA